MGVSERNAQPFPKPEELESRRVQNQERNQQREKKEMQASP